MKKLLIMLAFVPLLGLGQAKFASEEFMYLHRPADSTNETTYCAHCFDSLYTRWGAVTGMDSLRRYMDSVYVWLNTQDTAGFFTIYNQYGTLETDIKAQLWAHSVATKLMYNLRQYAITPSTRRAPIRQNFIEYCRGYVYIRHFK